MNIKEFLNNSPTCFNASETVINMLKENGYKELNELNNFVVEKGNKYFISRNESSVIAFNVGKTLKNVSLQVCASHSDCPSFKIKPNKLISDNNYTKLNVEMYGGAICYPWFDRPLGLAGRISYKENSLIKTMNYKSTEAFCIIPSLAIHFNRNVNEEFKVNKQIDLCPICNIKEKDFDEYLSNLLNKEVLGYDLYLYPVDGAYTWGNDEYLSSFHLDDLACAYSSLMGFINNFNDNNINMFCMFDNEEVGSLTRQGADSDFFESTLKRICKSLDIDYYSLLSNGLMLSCDNAHASHPNHPEISDPVNRPLMNKGIVIKFNGNQSYTSDGLSSAIFKDLLNRFNIAYQYFTNRSDLRGGSTLGNISNGHVSLLSLDIGLAQLAMHSPLETMGYKDIDLMIKAMGAFYSSHLENNTLK